MNFKIGNDIIETKRIEKLYCKFNKKFTNKVYTEKEIEYCESKGINKFQSYAARFSGKEAVYKAISGLLATKYEIGWKNIEILNDDNGRPFVNIKGIDFIGKIDISLSHIKDCAIATAIVVID